MSNRKDDAELTWNVISMGCITSLVFIVFIISFVQSKPYKKYYYATCTNGTSLAIYRKGTSAKYYSDTTNEEVFLTSCVMHEAINKNTEYVTACGEEKVYHMGVYEEIFVLDDGSYRYIDATCTFTVERDKQ